MLRRCEKNNFGAKLDRPDFIARLGNSQGYSDFFVAIQFNSLMVLNLERKFHSFLKLSLLGPMGISHLAFIMFTSLGMTYLDWRTLFEVGLHADKNHHLDVNIVSYSLMIARQTLAYVFLRRMQKHT